MRADVAGLVASTTDLYAADEILAAAGSMHLDRYATGPGELDEAQLACGFFAPLLGRRNTAIPAPLREMLTGFRDEADGAGDNSAHPRAAIRRVLRGGAPDDGAWADLLEQMSSICHAQFDRTGDLAAAAEALVLMGHATASTPKAEERRVDRAAISCRLTHALGRATGDQSLLEVAVDGLRKLADRVDHPHHQRFLTDLGVSLYDLYRQTHDGDVLAEMVDVDRRAVRKTAPGEPFVGCLTNLGVALLAEYADRGQVQSLDEACVHLRRAAELAPVGWKRLPYLLTALGSALREVDHRGGDLDALDEAIEAMNEAVQLQPDDDPDRAGRMANLAQALIVRCGRVPVPGPATLERAAGLLRQAEGLALTDEGGAVAVPTAGDAGTGTARGEATPDGRSAAEAPLVLSGLAAASDARYRDTHDVRDLDAAIAYAERAVDAAERPADRWRSANNAGILLARRHEVARDCGEPTGDFLERAERYLADAIADQVRVAGAREGADHRAASTAANVGAVMALRLQQTDDDADWTTAVESFRTAANDHVAPPSIRAEAAASGGRVAATGYDWAGAVELFTTAIELLEQAVPRSLRRGDGEYRLVRLRGLASDAAACALWCYDAGHAVELLEEGRGVLLAQTMDVRNDLARLREREPALADELDALHQVLDDPQHRAVAERTSMV